jgi:hypothetical protein
LLFFFGRLQPAFLSLWVFFFAGSACLSFWVSFLAGSTCLLTLLFFSLAGFSLLFEMAVFFFWAGFSLPPFL